MLGSTRRWPPKASERPTSRRSWTTSTSSSWLRSIASSGNSSSQLGGSSGGRRDQKGMRGSSRSAYHGARRGSGPGAPPRADESADQRRHHGQPAARYRAANTASSALASTDSFSRPPCCASPRPSRRHASTPSSRAHAARPRVETIAARRTVSGPGPAVGSCRTKSSATTRPRTASPRKASVSLCGAGGCSCAYEGCVRAWSRRSGAAVRPSRDARAARALPLGLLRTSVRAARLVGRRGRGATQARQRRNASVALVPPNPKPFDSAASTSTFRAAFGT